MKKSVVFLFVVFLVIILAHQRFCLSGTLEDIRRKVGRTDKAENGSKPADSKRGSIQIQNVSKGVVSGWVFDQGAGTRMVRCIDLKFKISKRGQVGVDYFCVYLFDRQKKEVKKLTDYLVQTPAGTEDPPNKGVFPGNRTNTARFVYQNEVTFKYCLAVVGNNTDGVYAMVSPKAALEDFEFEEKGLIKTIKQDKKTVKEEP